MDGARSRGLRPWHWALLLEWGPRLGGVIRTGCGFENCVLPGKVQSAGEEAAAADSDDDCLQLELDDGQQWPVDGSEECWRIAGHGRRRVVDLMEATLERQTDFSGPVRDWELSGATLATEGQVDCSGS